MTRSSTRASGRITGGLAHVRNHHTNGRAYHAARPCTNGAFCSPGFEIHSGTHHYGGRVDAVGFAYRQLEYAPILVRERLVGRRHRYTSVSVVARTSILGVLLAGCPPDPPGRTSEGTDTGTGTGAGTSDPTSGLDETGTGECSTVLQGVPGVEPDCPAPGFFADECGEQGSQLVVDSTTIVAVAPETQEAEVSLADFGMVSFTAVIESTWSTVGGHCVIEKKIRAYERNGDGAPTQITVEPPGGPGADNEDLASDPDTPNALVWYTDPYLAVSDHGTLYLSVLKAPGTTDDGDGFDCDDQRPEAARDYDNEVQLWVRSGGGGPLRKVATIEDEGGFFYSEISAGFNQSNPNRAFLDHPRVAAWTDQQNGFDRVVVTWTTGNPGPDQFVTLECNHMDPVECAVIGNPFELISFNIFPNPAFDEDGALYIARRSQYRPQVEQLAFVGGAWVSVSEGGVPAGVSINADTTTEISSLAVDPTPAIWVGRIGQATTPSVFVAWTAKVEPPAADPLALDARVLLSAAHAGDLSAWTEPVQMREGGLPRSNEWGPEVRVNGADGQSFVDVIFQRGPEGNNRPFLVLSGPPAPAFSPWLTRFRAHDLMRYGEVSIAEPGQEVFLDDVPTRAPSTSGLFAGEYLGLTQDSDSRAIVGWPLGQGPGSLGIPQPDLALSVVDFECVGP